MSGLNKLFGSDEQELLEHTILAMTGELDGENLKLADYIRLLDLCEELEGETNYEMRAGWVNQCQNPDTETEG